jgi:dienelactone hydrolase
LATVKSMEATAKDLNKPMELVIYPDAGHNFIKGAKYGADDADDAWRRATDAVHQYLNETSAH